MQSLYDLFLDIRDSHIKEFQYDNEPYSFSGFSYNWVVTQQSTGFTATCRSSLKCMLDLQGAAASLLCYKKSIAFDSNEQLIS